MRASPEHISAFCGHPDARYRDADERLRCIRCDDDVREIAVTAGLSFVAGMLVMLVVAVVLHAFGF